MDKLITRQGYQRLTEELKQLWRIERPQVTQKVTWAAGLGDRSENADYQYNKQLLRKIDRRIHYLSRRLEQLNIVDPSPQQYGKVYFGAYVTLERLDGYQVNIHIVGVDEIFQHDNDCDESQDQSQSLLDVSHVQHVSIRSPIARALLGKCVGDEVKVTTPKATHEWLIIDINYHPELSVPLS